VELGLSGRTVLVTGASQGLGRHFAVTVARAGAERVVVAARSVDKLAAVAEAVESAGSHAVVLPLDVSSPAAVRAGVAALREQVEAVDVLINNAGGSADRDLTPALEVDDEEWDTILRTNLDGTWHTSQEVARWSRELGRPLSIVNLGSVLGLRVMPRTTAYATAKAAVVQLTRQLALEWARYGIRVNALCPGYVPTEAAQFQVPEVRAAMEGKVPFRRLGELEELDGPLLLLASDAGSYMSGTTVVVDGALSVAGL
jgi:NAD(P)-dependent dehydrogenase (short-subunit alcohol dehydrogenase family)